MLAAHNKVVAVRSETYGDATTEQDEGEHISVLQTVERISTNEEHVTHLFSA